MQCPITFIDDYEVLALIGDGGQANVYLCVKNSKIYAAKVFNSGLSKSGSFSREAKLLSLMEHDNLIKMIYSNSEANIKSNDQLDAKRSVIVLEYAQKGQLFQYISIGKAFKPEICKVLFLQLLNGMHYLAQQRVAHRDIKPQNILFDSNFTLKISDFGLSTFYEGKQKDFILKSKVGTEGFKAPQIQQGEYNGEKADIFSLGVILFVLYVGSPPFFTTKTTDKIYRHIVCKNYERFWSIHQKNKPKGFFPEPLKQLFNNLLSKNPEQRPTLENLKQNTWLITNNSTKEEVKKQLNARYSKIIEESDIKRSVLEKVSKIQNGVIKEQSSLQNIDSSELTGIQTYEFIQKLKSDEIQKNYTQI